MGLLNYTTAIDVSKTIGEINAILTSSGANAIMTEIDGTRNVTAISFKAKTEFGIVAFRLPCDVSAATLILNKQVQSRKIPRKFHNNTDQARKIAWRIIKDWLLAQMALIELGMAKIEQVFLPYAQDNTGQTVYEILQAEKFKTLALPESTN